MSKSGSSPRPRRMMRAKQRLVDVLSPLLGVGRRVGRLRAAAVTRAGNRNVVVAPDGVELELVRHPADRLDRRALGQRLVHVRDRDSDAHASGGPSPTPYACASAVASARATSSRPAGPRERHAITPSGRTSVAPPAERPNASAN